MNENASVDTGHARQIVVPHATPSLRKRLAAFEALGGDRDGLYAPITASLIRVENIEWLCLARDIELGFQLEQVLLHNDFK